MRRERDDLRVLDTLFDVTTVTWDECLEDQAPHACEGHGPVLDALSDQQCLLKTVANEDWIGFIRKLQGPPFRTSTTLPPPGAKGMRLFGKVPSSCLGLLWDRRKLNLSDAFIWPSGYFAKSEFNVAPDGSLLNGRQDALVTVEDLLRANTELSYFHYGKGCNVTGELLPYNEVLLSVHGAGALTGIFARSTLVTHLIWAMGIRALLVRVLPAVGDLPLFVHDPELGMRPFGNAAQCSVVRQFLHAMHRPMASAGLPCIPLDTHLLEMDNLEQLDFHGAHGITEEALTAVVNSLLKEGINGAGEMGSALVVGAPREQDVNPTKHGNSPMCRDSARAILARGLCVAVEANNATSATSLVRCVAPLLFESANDTSALSMLASNAPLLPVINGGEDFGAYLHKLAGRAVSQSVLVPVGATIALDDFASGRMLPRIMGACAQLEAWLANSDSLVFRLRSWHELHAHHAPGDSPTITSFMRRKAVENRSQFYRALLELEKLEESHDVLHGMQKLHALVAELHHPCLRLQMLQHILGLDDRFDLQAIAAVAKLALKVISDGGQRCENATRGGRPVLPRHAGAAPLFQLEVVACHMQGLDHSELHCRTICA